MLRLAASFVPSQAVAEEVVQDTWLGVLRGIDGFEGRSSLKTWLFRILVNRARTTGVRERRSVPVADPEPAVDAARFDASGSWAAPPEHWIEEADDRLEAGKLAGSSGPQSRTCPPRQREVVMLRDVEGLTSEEVCAVLDISEATSGSCCTGAAAGCASARDRVPGGAMILLRAPSTSSASRQSNWSPTTSRAHCPGRTGGGSRATWPAARTAPSTSPRCGRPSGSPAGWCRKT